jgi:hypothetical protein
MTTRTEHGSTGAIQQARDAGWHIDRDGWWTRAPRVGDLRITDSAIGFTSDGRGDPAGPYVRTAEEAIDYDRGVQS